MPLSGDRSNFTLGGNFPFNESTPRDISIELTGPTILSWIIFALTFLLGVPGNGAVAWVTGFKMKRNVHTVCFLNLAVADLSYCLILPFLVALFFVESWRQNLLLETFIYFASCLNMSASIFMLTLISITRCLAVTQSIWFRKRQRPAWVCAACFGAWCMAFLMSLPHLLFQQIASNLRYNTEVVVEVTWAFLAFGLPVTIMAACYLLIAQKLRVDQSGKSRKPVRLILTVVAAFVFCWLPVTVCRLLRAFSQLVPLDWMGVIFALASFNSALNPLLYVFAGRDFRRVFRRSLAASLHLAFAEEDTELRSALPYSAVFAETSV